MVKREQIKKLCRPIKHGFLAGFYRCKPDYPEVVYNPDDNEIFDSISVDIESFSDEEKELLDKKGNKICRNFIRKIVDEDGKKLLAYGGVRITTCEITPHDKDATITFALTPMEDKFFEDAIEMASNIKRSGSDSIFAVEILSEAIED